MRNPLNKSRHNLSPEHLAIERTLLPRLRFTSYVFFVLALSSTLFALICAEEFPTSEGDAVSALLVDEEDPLNPTEVFNFHLVSLLFASFGGLCLLIEKSKTRSLFPETSSNEL